MNRRSHSQPVLRIRSSKFKHVFCSPARKEACYDNVKITKNAHDSQFCAVNPKFVAIVTESSGGGSFLVIPHENTGRLEVNQGRVNGHQGPVSDLKWCPFNDNVIASASDDCTVRIWYIPDEGPPLGGMVDAVVTLYEHKRRVAFIEWHPTAEHVILSAGFDYMICIWNASKGQVIRTINCHPETIQSMSLNRDGSLLATTCKDKILRIIDLRKGVVIRSGVCHEGPKSAKVAYLGDSGRLFTTGFSKFSDRQWAVWSQNDLSKPLRLENIDSSSGVLFPFYDHDTKMVYVAGKGDGSIRYYEVVDEGPNWAFYLSQYITGHPQRGLGIMPKRGLDTEKCEVFRFYKLHATRPLCEPLSMIVPRKSQLFQPDIYPDTAAPIPALTADEWFAGNNRSPTLISMKSEAGAKTHKSVVLKNDSSMVTGDFNNDKKFIFISQEVKGVDYRPKSLSPRHTNGHHANGAGGHGSPMKKFPWLPDPALVDRDITAFIVKSKDYPEDGNFVTDQNRSQARTQSNASRMHGKDVGGSYHEIIQRQQQEIMQMRHQLQIKDARIDELESIIGRLAIN